MLRLTTTSAASSSLRLLARRDAGCMALCNQFQSQLSFHSRAHPVPTPEYSPKEGLDEVLKGVQERMEKREKKWNRKKIREAKEVKEEKDLEKDPYRNQDEILSFAANLNLDPRRPGQAIRGSLTLPHGTGKTTDVVVFTKDAELAKRAEEEGGAKYAGGTDLINKISQGEIGLGSFQRSYATSDILKELSKSLARSLGPRGLMPNKKSGTVFDNQGGPERAKEATAAILNSLATSNSTIQFRADPHGIVHVPVGKASFGNDKLLDNLRAVCERLHESKPESFGKGKKGTTAKSKNAKYWLRAHVSATQGKGCRLKLKTVDPTSPFFMKNDEDIAIAA